MHPVWQICCERNRVMRDKLLESCHTGQRFLQLVASTTVTCAERSSFIGWCLRCDTSCRDTKVTLSYNWKICCGVARRVAQNRIDFYFSQRWRHKNVAHNVCGRVCYTDVSSFFKCKLKCWEIPKSSHLSVGPRKGNRLTPGQIKTASGPRPLLYRLSDKASKGADRGY